MLSTNRLWWTRFRYRLTHASKFPKGDLFSFFVQLAQQGFTPRHIYDIGANKAKWSRKASRVFPNCKFTLVEPQLEMKPYLDKFCRRVRDAKLIIAGISDHVGEMKLTMTPDTVSSGFLHCDETSAANNWQQRVVPVYTLNHLTNEHSVIPDIVKIDAEGMEGRIMTAASRLLGKTELFLLEAPISHTPAGWHSFSEIVSMMSDYGYECYEFTHMMRQRNYAATSVVEVAFARRDGFLRSSYYSALNHRRAA